MSVYHEFLKECERLRNSIGFQGIEREKVVALMRQSLVLEKLCARLEEQRDGWIASTDEDEFDIARTIKNNNAELDAIVAGEKETRPRKNVIEMWVVYESPSDYPGMFLARKWVGANATQEKMASTDLGAVHEFLGGLGFIRVHPDPRDNAAIKEIWL